LRRARWLVPKFAENTFSKAYTKSVYIFRYFVYTVRRGIVGNAESVQVGCGAVWAVRVGPHKNETRRRA